MLNLLNRYAHGYVAVPVVLVLKKRVCLAKTDRRKSRQRFEQRSA